MIERDHSTSLVDRVRARTAHALDEFFHPISREAERQLSIIADKIHDTPLGESLNSVRPHLRETLKLSDTSQAVRNIVAGLWFQIPGALFLVASGIDLRDRHWRQAAGSFAVGGGLIGLGVLGQQARLEGTRDTIRRRGKQFDLYYGTEIGKRAAGGMGTSESESLTRQVDRIVRRLTLNNIESISGEQLFQLDDLLRQAAPAERVYTHIYTRVEAAPSPSAA